MHLQRKLLLIACILPCIISAQNVVTPKVTFSLPGGAITSLPFPQYGPIGIAVTANQLVTTLNGCQIVDSVSATGTVTQPFITLPSPGPIKTGICESYVAISPGLGGFTAGDIFVTQGNLVYEYTPGGAYVKTFTVGPAVTFNGNNGAHTGISFDSVGTFNNQMIVTVFDDNLGSTSVYTVNAAGTANLLTTLPGENESPEVIPAGQLLVAAGAPSYNVIALNAQGVPVHYYSAGDAEAVRYIPTNPCTFAGASYFQAEYAANQIVGIAPADIAAAAGSALVPSECCHGTEIVPPSQSYPNGFFVINEPDSTYPIQTQEGNAVCVALPPPPPPPSSCPAGTANSTLINNLGLAGPSNFSVLSLGGTGAVVNINLATVLGNVGVPNYGTLKESAPSVIKGNVIIGSSVNTTGVVGSHGPIMVNDSLLSQAVTAAKNASTAFAALPSTPAVQAQFPASGQITGNLTVTGTPGLNVVNLSNFTLNNGSNSLTLTGPAGTAFVINDSGNFNLHTGNIKVSGGVGPLDVVYNITNPNATVTTMVPTTAVGILLAPNNNINSMDSSTFTGEVIGGSGKTIVLMSGTHVTNPCQ